jgi:hypothetical protein
MSRATWSPGASAKYSFVPGNRIVFNPPGRQFDVVIMMNCSQCPIHPQLEGAFRESVTEGRGDRPEVRCAAILVGIQGPSGDGPRSSLGNTRSPATVGP